MKIVAIEQKWVRCPFCGAKHSIYDNTANCKGVFLKCTRGCKRIFELVIKDGEQVTRNIRGKSRDFPKNISTSSHDEMSSFPLKQDI